VPDLVDVRRGFAVTDEDEDRGGFHRR
jgi:hypothetical protein